MNNIKQKLIIFEIKRNFIDAAVRMRTIYKPRQCWKNIVTYLYGQLFTIFIVDIDTIWLVHSFITK